MKKIVYIVGGVYGSNGMSQVLTQKINWLARNTDYRLHIVLTERPDLPSVYEIEPSVSVVNFGINFDELDTMPLTKKLLNYRSKQKKYKKLLTDYLMEVKADIVVSACRREINFINDINDGSHKIGEIHFGRVYYRNFSKPWLPKFVCKCISRLWINQFVKAVEKLDRFVVLSKEDKANWGQLKNITVINNPLKHFPADASDCNHKRVIAIGRYTTVKGFDLLLQAWVIVQQMHPDWRLDIFGPGNVEPYKQLAHRLNIDKTVACNCATNDVYKEFLRSSIYVLSSRHEGFGLVVAEAMSCGVPAVSFACPCGPREIINDGKDGLLVEPENIVSLGNAICKLIEDEDLRKALGRRAKENARRFNEPEIMWHWVKLFDTILKES